jgi:hypothetical protein
MKTFNLGKNNQLFERAKKLVNKEGMTEEELIMDILMTGLVTIPEKIKAGQQSEKFNESSVYLDKNWWTWNYAKFLGKGTVFCMLVMFFISTA